MLIKTIEHVLGLEYTNYELIIVENNTQDEAVWKPVADFVKSL
jgi:glycosyltransferase involved in cell wall biosynthesis